MVKTLERDRYALCEKHVIVPFCCSHQMYRYLAGCFGLISGRHCLANLSEKHRMFIAGQMTVEQYTDILDNIVYMQEQEWQ